MADVIWKGDLDNDCHATHDEYVLFVTWKKDGAWWSVVYNGSIIKESSRFEYSPSMRGGRLKALYAMRRHKNKS